MLVPVSISPSIQGSQHRLPGKTVLQWGPGTPTKVKTMKRETCDRGVVHLRRTRHNRQEFYDIYIYYMHMIIQIAYTNIYMNCNSSMIQIYIVLEQSKMRIGFFLALVSHDLKEIGEQVEHFQSGHRDTKGRIRFRILVSHGVFDRPKFPNMFKYIYIQHYHKDI